MRRILDRIIHFNQRRLDQWVETMAKQVPAGSRVLDVGAGGAPYRGFFSHCSYKTHDFCQLPAEQIIQGGYASIDYVSDAASIPVAAGSFDAVLCTEVLEHVPSPVSVLREIGRVLRSGGILILTAPLGSGLHQEPFHFYGGYTPYFYHRFLSEAGFSTIDVKPKGDSFAHFAQWLIWFFKASNPLRFSVGPVKQIALSTLYLLTLPMTIALFFYARALEGLDSHCQFTGGYLVHAKKG